MIIKISSRVMALALLFAVPLALHATPIQPTVITKWYSGVNDAATLGIQTGAGGLTGRHVQWEDTEVKPTHPGQIMGLEQTVGVIQYRSAPLLQGHGLYSFNDAFGTDSDQMPSNSVITSARLWLYVTSFASTQTITVAGLAPLNRDWIENSACYSYQSNFTPWVGGTFTGAVLKSYATIPNPTAVGWMSIDIAEPIRDYVTNVIGSVALLSQNNQAANVQNAYFASDENDNPKWAPGMRSTFWLLYSPNRLPASDIWAQKFTANWERVLGVGVTITNYHLDVATDPRFYQTVGIYSNLEMGAALSCVVTGLTENTTYYYRLHCHLGRVVSFFNVNTLVQTRRLQTLVFPPISSQWVGNVVSLLATTESGLTPTFTVVDGPGIIAGLNQLSFSGTGMVSVVASQLGDPFWDPALPPVTNTFLVYKNAQAITSFTALGTHRNTEIVHMSATASSGLPVSFAVGSGLGVITSGNILSFTGTGLVQVVASQAGDFYYLAAAPVTNDCPVYGTVTTNTGNAGMALSGLSVVYDGTPHPVTVVTDPLGLSNDVTYIDDPVVAPAGNTNPPVNAGTYNVFAWLTNSGPFYGTAANVMTINKGLPAITNLIPLNGAVYTTTNIVAISAQASSGVEPVRYSVRSGPGVVNSGAAPRGPIYLVNRLIFTGEGTVELLASQIGDGNWYSASVVSTVTVVKATGSVILANLTQVYDGTSRRVTASTVPAHMTVNLTYDGSTNAPSHVGTYTVIGTISDQIYGGASTGTLTIGKGLSVIHFPQIPDQYYTRTVGLAATSDSGQPVIFDLLPGGPGQIAQNGTNLSFSTTGVVSVVASDPLGDVNWLPVSVTNTFAVHDVLVWLAGTNGQLVASSSMPVLVKGTDYGTVGLTTAVTNNFRVGNETGSAIGMTWTTNGTGSAAFRVVSFAGNIAAGGISNLLIRFAPPSAGVYTTAVAFASAGLGPDPFVLYFSATGAPAATLGFDSAGLNFATDYGNDPAGQTLVITNNGSVQAAYTAAVSRLFVPLGSPTLNWLSISPTLGAIDGHGSTAISVQASAYGLDVGVYHGTVTVYSVQATNSPQAIPVTLTITQALATVSLADLYQVYDGNAKPVMAWTTPSGKNVDLTYDGLAYAPTNPGSYAVTGVVNELNYYGSNVDRLRISLNDGIVNLGNLVQIYDGTPRIATYTTEPTNLTVDVTYDGSPTPPTNAGLYAVEGAINDPIYQGSSTGTLTVYQKHQWIAFQNPGQQETPSRFGLYATASSGLTVLFNVLSGPGVISGLTNLTFTDTGTVNIVASQPGDRNWYAAPAVGYLINVDTNRAPTIEIIIPTTNANYNSDTNLLTFGGTAADNVAVASVTLRNSRDVAAYTCTGTTNWQFTGFPLYQGSNYVTAVAYDLVGNSSTDAVAVAFTNDTRYDDVLRSGGMIQEIIFPDNLTTGATVKVQWKILSYVPVVCRVYAGDLAATWSFFKSGIFTGVTQSPWNLFGRHANIYSFECDWTVPQKPGEFRVWFNAAQMDGDQYMIPVIPDGVDARPDLVHPKLIQRTILPGGSVVSGNPPSDPDIWNPADIFETREQQLERAGASITYINLASNLIVGASVTSEWKVLSYVDINSQVILLDAVPTNIWLVADATLVGSPQITTYRFKNRQDGTMWYYAYEYTFRTTFVVPDVPGMQQLYFRCKRSDNPASAPMAASISAGVDPEPWLFNSMYGRFIERLVVDPGP